jgi:hypothetical protein
MKTFQVWGYYSDTGQRQPFGDDFETKESAQNFMDWLMQEDNHPDDMWIEEINVE